MPEVLLVEDNPGDIRLTQEYFRTPTGPVRLHVVADGIEAMAFLRREGSYVSAPRPDVILLDLNLPKMDGRELLAKIKKDTNLKMIPTIVLTSSDANEDVLTSYQLQASCFLRKPSQWDDFASIMTSIGTFWLAKAKLPTSLLAT
jgi:chemotaxis family two-component system response regulator Rcp1